VSFAKKSVAESLNLAIFQPTNTTLIMRDYSDPSNQNPYASPYSVAAQSVDVRAQFIKKTYIHLAFAIAAFAALEWVFFQIPAMIKLAVAMTGGFSWLIVMAVYMGVSMLAHKWANSNTSQSKQYLGLGLYVVAMAVLTLPLLLQAVLVGSLVSGSNLILNAAVITVAMVIGITVIAFTTKKDFSFLSGFLKIGGFIAMGMIVLSIAFGFSLGILFSGAMVIFASVSVLRDTSNIIHQYNTNQYVAASLGLFSSVALLFWYVLQVLMSLASSD